MKEKFNSLFQSPKFKIISEQLHIPIVLSFIAIGSYYRIIHLDLQSVWYDELFSIIAASKSSLNNFFEIYKNETNPPLHGFLLFNWFRIFGNSPMAARSISVISGIFTLILLLLFAIKAQSYIQKKAIYISILFMSVSFGGIYFSQEARPYSLMILLSVPITFYYCKFWNSIYFRMPISFKQFSVFIFFNILISYTHYFGFIFSLHILGILGLLSLIRKSWKSLAMIFIGSVLFLSFYLPEIIKIINIASTSENISWIPKPNATIYYEFFNYVFFINRLSNSWIVLVLLLSIYVYNYKYKSQQEAPNSKVNGIAISVLILIALFFISTFLYSSKSPIITGRNLLVLCFPLIYFCSILFAKPNKPNFAIMIILIAFLCYKLLNGFTSDYYKPFKQDFRGAAKYLIENNKNNSPIYSYDSSEYYNYYLEHLSNEQNLKIHNYENSNLDFIKNPISEFYLIENSVALGTFPEELLENLSQEYYIIIHELNGLTTYKLNKKE